MRTPEGRANAVPGSEPGIRFINDFELCSNMQELKVVMETINRNQYTLISVTQNTFDAYTVFFRRCVVG